jgi:hypothetical protein
MVSYRMSGISCSVSGVQNRPYQSQSKDRIIIIIIHKKLQRQSVNWSFTCELYVIYCSSLLSLQIFKVFVLVVALVGSWYPTYIHI